MYLAVHLMVCYLSSGLGCDSSTSEGQIKPSMLHEIFKAGGQSVSELLKIQSFLHQKFEQALNRWAAAVPYFKTKRFRL